MLGRTIRCCRNRAIEAAPVIKELIALACGEALGLSDDQLSCYDALGVKDSAVQVLGDVSLRDTARKLVETA